MTEAYALVCQQLYNDDLGGDNLFERSAGPCRVTVQRKLLHALGMDRRTLLTCQKKSSDSISERALLHFVLVRNICPNLVLFSLTAYVTYCRLCSFTSAQIVFALAVRNRFSVFL